MASLPTHPFRVSRRATVLPRVCAAAVLALHCFALPGTTGADDPAIYQWTDESGVKHFSNTPPQSPVKNLETLEEIPYDPDADRERMEEDEAWMRETERRQEEARRKAEAEKAARQAREAEEKRLAEEREKEMEAARQAAEEALEKEREQHRSTHDKSVFVNPGDKIPGINTRPRPTPHSRGADG